MDVEDDVGAREVEQVGIAGDVARVVGEALAAVVGVLEPGELDHRPPGTVEHGDPLLQQRSQFGLCAHLPSTVAERGRIAIPAGSLGVW